MQGQQQHNVQCCVYFKTFSALESTGSMQLHMKNLDSSWNTFLKTIFVEQPAAGIHQTVSPSYFPNSAPDIDRTCISPNVTPWLLPITLSALSPRLRLPHDSARMQLTPLISLSLVGEPPTFRGHAHFRGLRVELSKCSLKTSRDMPSS